MVQCADFYDSGCEISTLSSTCFITAFNAGVSLSDLNNMFWRIIDSDMFE